MNQRLQQFIQAENINQAQLADSLSVARASVSNILSGRNKPGFDFLESLSRHYPDLNLEWLITGRGRMYKTRAESTLSATSLSDAPIIDELFPTDETLVNPVFEPQIAAQQPIPLSQADIRTEKKIVKILVFFDDGSYQEIIS